MKWMLEVRAGISKGRRPPVSWCALSVLLFRSPIRPSPRRFPVSPILLHRGSLPFVFLSVAYRLFLLVINYRMLILDV